MLKITQTTNFIVNMSKQFTMTYKQLCETEDHFKEKICRLTLFIKSVPIRTLWNTGMAFFII